MTNDTGVELPGAVVEASKVVEPITVEPILAVIVAVPLVAGSSLRVPMSNEIATGSPPPTGGAA